MTHITLVTSTQRLYYCQHRCSKKGALLEARYEELLLESSSPLYWNIASANTTTSSSGWKLLEASEPQESPAILISQSSSWIYLSKFLDLELTLSNTIALTCSAILSSGNHAANYPFHTQPFRPGTFNSTTVGTARYLPLNRARDQHPALNAICPNDSMGLPGAQQSLFALRVALIA